MMCSINLCIFSFAAKMRDEICAEWATAYSNLEKKCNQRIEDTKEQYQEFYENRCSLLTKLLNDKKSGGKGKRRRHEDEEESLASACEVDDLMVQMKKLRDEIGCLQDDNQLMNETINKLKANLKVKQQQQQKMLPFPCLLG